MNEPIEDDILKLVQEQERITALHLEGRGTQGNLFGAVLNRNLDQLRHESDQTLQQLGGTVNPVLAVGKEFAERNHDVVIHSRTAAEVAAIKAQAFVEDNEVANIDLDRFLENSYQDLLMDVVHNSRESLSEELQKWSWTSQRSDWDRERSKLVKQMALQIEKIRDHQAGGLVGSKAPMQLQNMQALLGPDATQIAGIKRERSGRASLDEKMQQYAEVVEFIVDPTSQLQAQTVPAMLRNVGRTRLNVEPHVQLNCAVNRTWEIVEQLLTEVVTVADDNSDIKEKVQKRMIFAAAHYLGRQYFELVVTPTEKPGHESGSQMDPYEAYLRATGGIYVTRFNEPVSAPDFVWQHIYLRLRCWQLHEALDFARQHLRSEPGFPTALEAWINKATPPHELGDPGDNTFKKVLFSIVGGGDGEEFEPEIINTSEDFIWFRMAHLYPKTRTNDYLALLQSLQRDVVAWGPTSFEAYPLVYLQVLLLTQQFEQAVKYWWDPVNKDDCNEDGHGPRGIESLHLLLAIMDTQRHMSQQNSLLKMKTTSDDRAPDLLTTCGNGESVLDVVSLLVQFTKQFQHRDPKLAMHYLAMIPESEARVDAIVNLATETREYSRLFLSKRPRRNPLGDRDHPDHRGEPAGLEGGDVLNKLMRYTNSTQDAEKIMEGSAIRAAALGLWEEAIDLYMASKHYSKAVDTLTEQLERNYSDWQKGGRNQILIERAKRVLEDEGLTQGPAGGVSEGMHSRAMQGRTMQDSVRSLNKLYTIALFFDAFEKGEQAREELSRMENELARSHRLQEVPIEEYDQPGHPLRQKRGQVQLFYSNALGLLAESGLNSGHYQRPQLLPVFGSVAGSSTGRLQIGDAVTRLVEECRSEYMDERRHQVQSAIREMLGPVCDMQMWLFKHEDRFGHMSTKAQHKEILKMTNFALKQFATLEGVTSGVTPNCQNKLRELHCI